jgi:ribulose kinase
LATDFLAALVDWWGSNAALSAAGIGTLHFGTVKGVSYPFVVITMSGSNVSHRNFTKTYIDVCRWKFTITTSSEDQAVALGATVTAALDTLVDNPLAFDNGVQMVFQRTGDDVMKLRHSGTEGVPFVWVQSISYISKIMRTRA